MKTCVKCKKEKKFSEFHKNKSNKDGYQKMCKQCRKNHYIKNKEKILEKRKNHYVENKEKILERQHNYYTRNKEKILERISNYNKNYHHSYVLYDNYVNKLKPFGINCKCSSEGFLEVKCYKCKQWFKPIRYNVFAKMQNINGKTFSSNNFYCSEECKNNCCEYGLSPQSIKRNILINKGLFDDKLFYLYKYIVTQITEKNYKKYKKIINPNNLPRKRGKYHLDHKYSIYNGFINNILPSIIGSYKNLTILSENENLKKGKKSSITLEELI
jgi:hypothetical protein